MLTRSLPRATRVTRHRRCATASATVHGGDSTFLRSQAYWLDTYTLAVKQAGVHNCTFTLVSSESAALRLENGRVEGADALRLTLAVGTNGLSAAVRSKWPHLAAAGYTALLLSVDSPLQQLLVSQLVLETLSADGSLANATGVQMAGAIDALCATDEPLGCLFQADGSVALRVWAPTAQRVELLLYDAPHGGDSVAVASIRSERGVWEALGPWRGGWYSWRASPLVASGVAAAANTCLSGVTAFHPSTGRIEVGVGPDPYARVLAANGARAHAVCIEEARLFPPAWTDAGLSARASPASWPGMASGRPALGHHGDSVLYELHVRDFSSADESVPLALRGTFAAFELDSVGTRHLRSLAQAGVTHVHLLPVNDFGTVDEYREAWGVPQGDLVSMPPDGEGQQAAVMAVQSPPFNWGYDPVFWGVPDGSYATNPDGVGRTLELRTAVAALHRLGLRVVLDVVYNHIFSSGPASPHSVLDKFVPSYYLRRDEDGTVYNSTCMNNTASEHEMCSRLIVDDVVHWATSYGVDGFRFDLMGHLMKRTVLSVRTALDALGRADIILYGEGWDYAEVEGGRIGENASQHGMAGTGVATFNDRLRSGAIGGGPFNDPREQGCAWSLFFLSLLHLPD